MSTNTHRIAEAITTHIVVLSQTRLVEMVAAYKSLKRANEELQYLTGIKQFFAKKEELDEFQRLITLPNQKLNSHQTHEFGDFQTPPDLAHQVCQYLAQNGVSPSVIIEPTYGMGNFILAALDVFPKVELVYGVEIQERYEWHLKVSLLIRTLLGRHISAKIELYRDNIFTHEFPERITRAENFLILGNPPWVTSAALGMLESENLPQKQNLKALNGMDALTGKSNFDISEYILLRLLDHFALTKGNLAFLVKNSTVRNVVEHLPKKSYRISEMCTLEIDAAREFDVAVDANVFVAALGTTRPERVCQVATLVEPHKITREFGWVGNEFVSNVTQYEAAAQLEGESTLVWRQGLKHDCARVMELSRCEQGLVNGDNELVQVEPDYVYGLLKSSDLQRFEALAPRKQVIVTQKKLGEDTSSLQTQAPCLWRYLLENSNCLDQRKSSIYRNKPRFSIFGIGDYSFKRYKVAISGLYKEPNFSIVCPMEDRTVLVDDTCYMIGFDQYKDALFAASLYNSDLVKHFLQSITFNDAKRPFTKQALMRINITRVADCLSFDSLCDYWERIRYVPREHVTEKDYDKFKGQGLNFGEKQVDFQPRLVAKV